MDKTQDYTLVNAADMLTEQMNQLTDEIVTLADREAIYGSDEAHFQLGHHGRLVTHKIDSLMGELIRMNRHVQGMLHERDMEREGMLADVLGLNETMKEVKDEE